MTSIASGPVPQPDDAASPPESGGPSVLHNAHFIGIGGAGMSGIARLLLARGIPVSGSDAKESPNLSGLRSAGATVHVGHRAANLGDARSVVVSNAIQETNPELTAAREQNLPVLPRAAALAALMAGRQGVAVAGTAGKSSTSAMLAVAARQCGAEPSFAVGATLIDLGCNAQHGSGPLFIAEADESDSSFLLLSPDAAVITNIGSDDHLDLHGTAENYARAFDRFVDRIQPDGFIVAGADDPGSATLAEHARHRRRVRTFGESPSADLRLTDITVDRHGTTYRAILDGVELPRVRITAPGRHMALNSAAALLAAVELGLPVDGVLAGLAGYRGVRRRFEFKGEADGIRVYDDYGHNPTKVREQVAAARLVAGDGRLVVAFQPPLYSSTQRFAASFAGALEPADEVVVLDVSAAREQPIPGVTGALVAEAVPLPADRVAFCPARSAVVPELASRARPGDLVLTMGTGDVTAVGPELLASLRERATSR